MKDKVDELSNLGLKAFSIGTGDKEGFTEGYTCTSVGDHTAVDLLLPGSNKQCLVSKRVVTETTGTIFI